MAAKSYYFTFKDNPDTFVDCSNDKYSNLNLNQNLKNSVVNPIISKSVLVENKKDQNKDLTDINNSPTKKESNSWSNSGKNLPTITEDSEKRERSNKIPTNKSTLSLHIETYENSAEPFITDLNGVGNAELKRVKSDLYKQCFSRSVIQNPFEFPRQQKRNKASKPEVTGFRASQRLHNPNQPTSSKNVQLATAAAQHHSSSYGPRIIMADVPPSDAFSSSAQQSVPPQQIIQQQQTQQQQIPQQQMQQQPQQQQQQAVQRDVIPLFNERVRIIMEPNGDPKRKIKSFEEIRDLFDELYLKEHTPIVAQASVQIFQVIFQTVPVAFYDDKDTFQLRKSALDLVIRFVPIDQYKSSTKMFEDIFYQSIPKENELNAVFMIRYVIDMLRSQKVQHRQGVLRLITELRKIVENLYDIIVQRPEVFSRPQFNNDNSDDEPNIVGPLRHWTPRPHGASRGNFTFNIEDENYRNEFLDYLHFDVPIKPKRVHVYPRAMNSIKVLTEFSPMTHLMLVLFKDEVTEEISNLLRIFTAYLNYSQPKVNVDPEYSALFQETQLKILNFICMLVKPTQSGNHIHLVNPYRREIAIGARKLLRTLEASAINYRKEVMMTIKSLLTTELRVDLLDLIPDFCFEEIICGPPTIITPSFRSELFIIKADAFHNVRQSLDWVTFQHITMIIIRDYMDFTLSPALQGIYGKLVLNFIDACQKAENGSFPQLVIGYSYDSARMLYSNLFFSLTHRLDVVTQECTKTLLSSGSKSELAPKINEFYDSDEEDSGQEWMKDGNAKVEVENIDEPMDEFEREEPYDPEKGHSFVSIAMESFARKRTQKLEEKLSEVLKDGNFQETNKKRQADAERIERMAEKKEPKLSKHCFKTKDSRTQMLWFNRPLARNLEILPLIKSHSEIPPEKCNTFIPPEPFPYSIQDLRTIYKHYTGALRQLFIMVHFDDDLKSPNPPMEYFIALNKLFRNFIDIFELCNFSPSPNPPFVAPHNQAINSPEDKEMFEYFTVIFSSIHPSVYERILKHHLPYFMHRSTVSFSIQQLLLHILQTPLVIPTNMILFDYIYENMDILFLYDDDDKHRVDFFSKLIRLMLTFVMQNLRTEPLLKDYVSKIQTFFYKLITKTVHYIVRMYDASHLQAMLKTILRICGSPQAEHFYKLFLPMFPSFLHWFSALQNILAPEALQEYFIELCLSLPARLSSLVPYMSLLADPEINSFQNPLLLSQQGLRAIELCLDNYSAIHVRDFFGPSGIARLNENLWAFISTSMDHQLSLQCLKILGKLSSLNRNSLCDIQKLSFSSTEHKPDKPSIVVYFERSGKSTDDFISKQQLSTINVTKDLGEILNVQELRSKMYTFDKHIIETKPLQCNLLLRPILSHCVNILKNSLLTERNFTNVNRSDSAWLLLTWIRSAFDSYGAQVDKADLVNRILVINQEIMGLKIPYRSEISSARQMIIDCITGLSYAAANGDVKEDIEEHWEELIDFLTLQLHVETSIQYFGGNLSTSGVYPVSIDAFVLIDAIISILCEPHTRFHACAIYTLLRMIQTSRSFASTSEEALNIPLFHFLVQEVAQLCTHPESCHRLGGIYLLEIIIENFPTNFLFAAFQTLLTAALDVLHFGDDDISLTSQESAMEVGKKLIDKVFGQKSEDLFKYLASVVLKHSKSCSFWTNKLLCEILIYLQAQTTVSPLELFLMNDIQEFYKQHEIEFMNSKMEFRFVQLNLLVHLLNCAPHLLHFSTHTSNYLQTLASCFVHSDEILSNSPNYEVVPPHPPNGTNLVPSSPLFKPYGTPFFIERIKQFRTVVAGATAALCLNFYKSQNLTAIHFTSNFEMHDIPTAEEAAKFLLRLHATTVMKRTDKRFDLSVAVLAELGSHMVFSNKNTFINETINLLLSSPSRTYLYKALDALVKHKNDILHRQLSSLIISTNPQYFSLCQSLGRIVQSNEGMVEHLLAFLNVCRKAEYKDDKLFNDLFSMLSSKRILSMFELGEIDLFSPAVIFLGSDQECSTKTNNFFLSPVNLKDELKRKAYLTLICHPDGQHFLTSIKHCQQVLIDLIKHRVLKAGNFERAAEIEPMILDEFVFTILTKFASTFPNWFARNKKLAEFLRQFLLSDYFRGNYLLQDFCVGKNDRLRLTNFRLSLATVPDLVTNLLINYFTYNPKKYEILLALCSLLPQMSFADNGSLKRFISNFIVPRTTLLWRRNLLKFAMSKFVKVFNNFPKPSDDEDKISRQNDCQLYLGNFFLYIVVPCFSYALERFRARQVFNCEYDKIIGKQKWKKHHLHASKNSTDLVIVFCQNVLRRFQQHFQNPQIEYGPPVTIRPELSHGILQMAILLLQRASSHIHKPGSKKQSEHLQTMMQSAWSSLTQTGIYTDRWLRSVAYFLLSNVMNAFYIKRDIVYQLFDCLILLPDIRENPIAQKALDGIATHSARRRDECYQGLVDKIKEALTVDGFNATKVGNVLFMLANNYEAFFPARGTLLPSVVFVLVRIQNSRQVNVMNFIFDGLETIVGWEDLRTKKFTLIKDNLIRTANASQDPNHQRRIQNQIATLTRSPNFLAADRVLSDTISILLCRIMAQHPETERGKRFLAIFHKAIQPRLFCRVICLRFEKILTIRDPSQGQQQIAAQIQPIINTLKILSSFLITAAPDSIYHCLLYLQPVFAGSMKSQHISFMEAAVNLVAKLMEVTKELPVNEQKFRLLFQTLISYFSWAGENFISKNDWNDINSMLGPWKSICLSNETALTLFTGPNFIRVVSHMARTYRQFSNAIPVTPSDFQAAEKRQLETLILVLEMYIERATVISVETMALYLKEVITPLVKINESVNIKILELVCKTLEEASKPPHSIKQTHKAIVGALTRYHTQAIMKSSIAVNSFISTVAAIAKGKWDEDSAELQIPFYLGLTAHSHVDSKIRALLLDIYDQKLPKNIFERLCYLLMIEPWQLVNISGILPLMVEMLLRCIKDIAFEREPPPPAPVPTDVEEDSPMTDPSTIVEIPASINPPFAFWTSIKSAFIGKPSTFEVADIPDPSPCPQGVFTKTSIEFLPKRLKNICGDYFGAIERSNELFNKKFPEFMCAYLSVVYQEPDLAGKIFVELFSTLWSEFSETEREFVTELFAQFLQLPIFNSATEKTSKYFWQTIQKCNPPMNIDRTKILSTLSGLKNVHSAVYSLEMALPKSVNMLGAVSELRQMYRILNEEDMAAETWRLYGYSNHALSATVLYNQSKFVEALEEVQKAQNDYMQLIKIGEQPVDSVNVGIKNDYDLITNVGVLCLKQLGQWDEVYKHSCKTNNPKLGSEAIFYLLKDDEAQWTEFENMTRSFSSSEDVSDAFLCLCNHILHTAHENNPRYQNLFVDGGTVDRLGSVVAEKWRRLPSFYSPKYHEALADLSLYIDILDGAHMFKEVNTCILKLQTGAAQPGTPAGSLKTFLDSTMKQTVLHWHHRNISPSDTLEFATKFYKFRIVFLMLCNSQLRITDPDLKDPRSQLFTLTPMHSICDFSLKQCEHFGRYSLFSQAKKVIGGLPPAESFNALDGCGTICTVIKASMKQYQYQPTTVAYTNLKNELVAFLQADIKQFTPDCVALYAATRGQIFSFFKQISSVEENFRVSLKLLSTIDDINQAHTATKCYKMYSNYAFDRYLESREPAKGLAAVVGLLKYISRECHTKASRHILRLIYLVKRISSLPSPPDMLKTFYALGPKCRMINFVPYLHLLASEVAANGNEAFATLLILVAQVYPLHVLHAIYLQVGNEKFMKHIKNLQQLRTMKDEDLRIGKDFNGETNITEIHEYVYFNQKPDYATLAKMEAANRDGFPFKTWLNRKQLKTASGIFASLIYIINKYVPADVSAFVKVINGLEQMDNHFIERYYRNWTFIWDVFTTRSSENESMEKVAQLLPTLFEELNKFLEANKNDGSKLFLLQKLKKEFPKLDGTIEEKLHKIADYFSLMENVIEQVYSTIKLEDLSQELYNFTGKIGRVISFSSFLEPHTGHCIPHIDLFVPSVRIHASNGSFIKQLDVRLSNGKIVSYFIEPASIDQYFSSVTNSFSSLNLSAEKFPDTNRRGALFRIPNIFQLNGIRLFEVSHNSLNKHQNISLSVRPLSFIMADSTQTHPYKSIATYYSNLSNTMSTDDSSEHIQALYQQEKDLPSKCLFNWFINRYEDDLGCVWYLRKSLSTQMALFSLIQYTFDLNQMSLENLYFDMSFGKLFNVSQTFSERPSPVPFRLTPAFTEFFDLSVNGHFIPTMVSLAQAFLRKRFEDYFRPFYWDFWVRSCQKQGKRMTATEINEFDNRMNTFKQRLSEIANYNGDSDSTIFKLCNDSQSIKKRSVLSADLYPWF